MMLYDKMNPADSYAFTTKCYHGLHRQIFLRCYERLILLIF